MESSFQLLGSEKVGLDIMAPFYKRFATLMSAGVPIANALESQAKSDDGPLKDLIESIHLSVVDGNSLSISMAAHPQAFSALEIGLVKAGEETGTLIHVVSKLAEFSEQSLRLRRMVISSLSYPAILCITSLGLTILLATLICSQDDTLFRSGADLPGVTQLLLSVAKLMTNPVVLIVVPISSILAWAYLRQRVASSEALGLYLDHLQLLMPGVGRLILKLSSARTMYVLGLCLDVGIGLIPSLKMAEQVNSNRVVSEQLRSMSSEISNGAGMAASMANQTMFSPMLISMTEVGEQTGTLPRILLRMSENIEDEVRDALLALAQIIEPVLLFGSGAVVILVAYGVLAPTLNLMRTL